MKKILVMVLALLMLTATATAYTIEYNWNDIKAQGVEEVLAYSWGYDNGYDDASKKKAKQPFTMVNKWRRTSKANPDHLGSELAFREKSSYTKGYRDGYNEHKKGMRHAVGQDFLDYYQNMGVIKVVKTVERKTSSKKATGADLAPRGWNLNELDLSNVENLGYSIGYQDAKEGKSKTPLRLMNDLSKSERKDIRYLLDWIRNDRGTYMKKYKEGYEQFMSEAVTRVKETGIAVRGESDLPSQQTGEDQASSAWDLGYKHGYAKAMLGEGSAPHQIDNYEWLVDTRYNEQAKETTDRYWYNLPEVAGIQVSQNDIRVFYADETSYLKGYREGFSIAQMELKAGAKEMTDAEYVWKLGCRIAEEGGNPYSYNWIQRRYAQSPEELKKVKLVRYNRGELLKGYKSCK
jgi:hypothetical protein